MLTLFVLVVLEGKDILGPTGHLLGKAEGDELIEPNDVLDFELLEFEVCIENSIVELVLKSKRVSLGLV